jgi:RNA polymerase sigma factor (sigma-70 family)
MDEREWLAERFEQDRTRLRAVAYRMLGSLSEADDAVQEAWLRLNRSDAGAIENLEGWLTTVVSRVCLNILRSRATRREDLVATHVPDPVVTREDDGDPEYDALLADSVGMALNVVLETLSPPERLAFVLHDMFAVPFEDIARVAGRSPEAARQLASRARRRVQGVAVPDADLGRQRQAVDAFFAAARAGDFEALVALLDPEVVFRSDGGTLRPALSVVTRGAARVAAGAITFAQPDAVLRPVLVDGAAGAVVTISGRPSSVIAFTVANGKIVGIDQLADPERIELLNLSAIDW